MVFPLPHVPTHNSQQGRQSHLLEHKSAHSPVQDSFMAPISLRNKSLQGPTWSDCTLLYLLFISSLTYSAPSHPGFLVGTQQAKPMSPWTVVWTSAQNVHLSRVCLGTSLLWLKSLLKAFFSKRPSMTALLKCALYPPLPHSWYLLFHLFCSTFCVSEHLPPSLIRSFTSFLGVLFTVDPSPVEHKLLLHWSTGAWTVLLTDALEF